MWKIKYICLLLTICGNLIGRAHPVSVMTGDAVWAEGQLIINMQISLDNLLLHFQIPYDTEGNLNKNHLGNAANELGNLISSNFRLITPDTITPKVTISNMPFLQKRNIGREDMRNLNLEFEIRFSSSAVNRKLYLLQSMGDRQRGLQSTSLIHFHLNGTPQFVPIYNDVPVIIDLEQRQVIEEKFHPVFTIKNHEIVVRIPHHWTTGAFPFQLVGNGENIQAIELIENDFTDRWQTYGFRIHDNVTNILIRWNTFTWQMRRIALVVKKGSKETSMTLSCFRSEFTIEL